MKKLVLSLVAVAAFGFTANAQETEKPTFGFQETNVFVEGNFGFNSKNDKNDDTKSNVFNFNPKVGYMLSDKFAVGASFEVGSDNKKKDGTKVDKNNNFYGGVFGRYYFLELGQRFKTYAEVGVGYNQIKEGMDGVKTKGMRAGLNLGLNYFVTESIAISFNLGDVISYSSAKADGGKSVNEFNTDLNVFNNFFDTATFGLTYKF
ncbi:outer membrane beta-barrel protein [Myroides odoratimimus]|uniref:outer membrane beta-barrel protein n=1 Tax=Myroides odoratimimus TaxID=76832 RepID=UPI0025783CA5|nr:outer membrane beta-barrel protein [Myroides odoratimimus]MDM1396037.1 outer membrane beta-barrel protein [Myroides odoratimimus]